MRCLFRAAAPVGNRQAEPWNAVSLKLIWFIVLPSLAFVLLLISQSHFCSHSGALTHTCALSLAPRPICSLVLCHPTTRHPPIPQWCSWLPRVLQLVHSHLCPRLPLTPSLFPQPHISPTWHIHKVFLLFSFLYKETVLFSFSNVLLHY